VRRNEISHCGQTGIVGSLGAAFSTISDNSIHDINLRQTFGGAEMAGIKFHGAIDVVIRHNQIFHCSLGLWLDWMAQNARLTSNLFHDNGCDFFFEVDHGPILMDNNLCLSKRNLLYNSQGVALVHNLFAGQIDPIQFDERETPFHKAHSTELAGLHNNPCGDTRYYNNLLTGGADLRLQYDEIHLYGPAGELAAEKKAAAVKQAEEARLPSWMDGNVFFNGSHPSKHETNPLVAEKSNPEFKLVEKNGRYYLEGFLEKGWAGEQTRKLVTTKLLGKAVIPDLPFDHPDGTPYRIDTDYFGKKRNDVNPAPGPFEAPTSGKISVRVW